MLLRDSELLHHLFYISRYVAVHYPLNYSQAVNDVYALQKRICQFLLPVCGLSLTFNITKFFEATYIYSKYILLFAYEKRLLNAMGCDAIRCDGMGWDAMRDTM